MPTAAQLSENSHQGFDGIKAALCLGSMEAKSNTASGMPVCLWREGTGSRSSGKERDAETGLDYFGARYYSAPQGRFLSPDPGAYKLEDPRTFNRYAYVNNNPLKYVDPTGREASYVIDWEKKTITFYVSITLWGPGADEDYVKKLKRAVESAWQGKYKDKKSGVEFGVTTNAQVSLYGQSGEGLTARNGFYVGNDVTTSNFRNQGVDRSFGKRLNNDPGIYTGALNPAQSAEAHEAGHVLGLGDDYEGYFENGHLKYRSLPGHEGHLMGASPNSNKAAQDEINRLGNYVVGQSEATHKNTGTIIRLPEPPRPK